MSGANDPAAVSEILTLRTYFAERQRHGGRFLAEAILDLFEQRQIATSVMLRGIASFGPTNVIRGDRSLSLAEDLPVTISAVDTSERITALADDVVALVDRGVITLERSSPLPDALADTDDTLRLSLHVGRRHRIAGGPAYVAVCDLLHRRGFVGADVYLGVDGTVDGRRRRAHFFSHNGDVPLSIVGVGTHRQAAAAIDELRAMLPGALLTIAPAVVCKSDGLPFAPPQEQGAFQKLRVHTSESSLFQGEPIHRALIARLKESGHATGATVLRAIWGFRGAQRPHGDRFFQLSRHVPVTTVIFDTAANIAATYRIVDTLTEHQGLVTVEPLPGMLEVHAGQRLGTLDLGDRGQPH